MSEGTERPWGATDRVFGDGDEELEVGAPFITSKDYVIGAMSWMDSDENVANAELIVKAVNSHDAAMALMLAASKVDVFEAQYSLDASGYDADEYTRGRAAHDEMHDALRLYHASLEASPASP
jgi:hypothetical protein